MQCKLILNITKHNALDNYYLSKYIMYYIFRFYKNSMDSQN